MLLRAQKLWLVKEFEISKPDLRAGHQTEYFKILLEGKLLLIIFSVSVAYNLLKMLIKNTFNFFFFGGVGTKKKQNT